MKKDTVKKKSGKKIELRHGHSKNLILEGEVPDYSRFKFKKNQPKPVTRHSSKKPWDHLINDLDKGHEALMTAKEAGSFSNRARGLGYVVVLRKRGEDEFLVWFGGLKK
jgi:hypothetical protein